VAGTLTVAEVAAKTSTSLNSGPSTPAGEEEFESGALFDETASAYARIRTRTEGIMSELLNNNVRQSVVPYTKINPWATLSPIQTSGADSTSSTTAELDGLLQTLQTLLAYLVRALGTVPLRRLVKQMLQALESTLVDQIIMRHSFSGAGVTQLAIDINTVGSVVARAIDVGMVDVGMGKIHQAVKLLGLPIEPTKDDDDEGDELGLVEVSKRLFEGSGEDARSVLDELGLDKLSVGEARKTLARRVELGS
jgi:RAD50-interacting protein 1